MTFLCDEAVEAAIVDRLRSDGHNVDTDFGELVFRQERAHAGVVLLRLAGLTQDAKARATSKAVEAHASELAGAFTVVSPGAVRIRSRV